jgi:E3 ubiquitin-protein ligase HERC4
MGDNRHGQLGLGKSVRMVHEPRLLSALSSHAVIEVACGYFHTLFLTASQKVFACGWNGYGQCARSPTDFPIVYEVISLAVFDPLAVHLIAAGSLHSVFATERGTVYACGDCAYGQAGAKPPLTAIPQLIADSVFATSISAGDFHSILLDGRSSQVFAWGRNGSCGRLGIGVMDEYHAKPQRVMRISDLPAARGESQGANSSSLPSSLPSLSTTSTSAAAGSLVERVISVSAGDFHSAATTTKGRIYMWGGGELGALGTNTDDFDELAPICINELFPTKNVFVSDAQCGGQHTIARDIEGRVYAWGSNCYGKLGLGNEKDELRPKAVELGAGHCVGLSAGLFHSLFIMEDGSVMFAGRLCE